MSLKVADGNVALPPEMRLAFTCAAEDEVWRDITETNFWYPILKDASPIALEDFRDLFSISLAVGFDTAANTAGVKGQWLNKKVRGPGFVLGDLSLQQGFRETELRAFVRLEALKVFMRVPDILDQVGAADKSVRERLQRGIVRNGLRKEQPLHRLWQLGEPSFSFPAEWEKTVAAAIRPHVKGHQSFVAVPTSPRPPLVPGPGFELS